ncbi:MAG TPA: hypothetical protein VMG10_06325 [Gemmataceae bacterium]|nr:hypothetical protein [Gemmataceae bacterium]
MRREALFGREKEEGVCHAFHKKKIDIGVITSRGEIIDQEGAYALLGCDEIQFALIMGLKFTVFVSAVVERIIPKIHFFFSVARIGNRQLRSTVFPRRRGVRSPVATFSETFHQQRLRFRAQGDSFQMETNGCG